MTRSSALEALFAPRSITLVGATERAGSVGATLTRNLLDGGTTAALHLVNRAGRAVFGRPAWAGVEALPDVAELALVAVPADSVADIVTQLGRRGCKAAIVISAGFEGADARAASRRSALIEAAASADIRVLGPNCLGLISSPAGLNASFARGQPPAGNLAVLSQSGAVAAAVLDWAPSAGVGVSRLVTVGDALDLDLADLLDWLGEDPATEAILLYLEGLKAGPSFAAAARAAVRRKPVIVLKGGRSAEGAKAALTHTGALAGADAVYAAAFRDAGLLQVDSLQALLDAGMTFSRLRRVPARRVGIVTNGGGAGILAVDHLGESGCALAKLAPETLAALDRRAPRAWSRGNPVDLLGDAPAAAYGAATATLLQANEVDIVLALNCPTAVADSDEAAAATVGALRANTGDKPVFAAWLGERSTNEGRRRLNQAGAPCFTTPEAAIRAAGWLATGAQLADRAGRQAAEPAVDGRAARVRPLIDRCRAQGLKALDPPAVEALLTAYGLPFVRTRVATGVEDAAVTAEILGVPVALKILSRDISHKSDVGGVALGLEGRAQVRAAAREMLGRVRAARPDARLDGFLLQEMALRPKAQEVIAGLFRDPTFGAVVMVGHGGVAVEAMADRALSLAPLDAQSGMEMIGRTRVARLLAGYRDRPAADLAALAGILVAVGQIAESLPEIAELDLNPILCDVHGALVVDARVGLSAV